MRATAVPIDLAAIGYREDDTPALVSGTIVQRRLLDNAPRAIDEAALEHVFRDALRTTPGPLPGASAR
jgi:hypothetical protein